jgi:hypothetical protein
MTTRSTYNLADRAQSTSAEEALAHYIAHAIKKDNIVCFKNAYDTHYEKHSYNVHHSNYALPNFWINKVAELSGTFSYSDVHFLNDLLMRRDFTAEHTRKQGTMLTTEEIKKMATMHKDVCKVAARVGFITHENSTDALQIAWDWKDVSHEPVLLCNMRRIKPRNIAKENIVRSHHSQPRQAGRQTNQPEEQAVTPFTASNELVQQTCVIN